MAWMKGHVGHIPNPDYEVADYEPQNWEHAPRFFFFYFRGFNIIQ